MCVRASATINKIRFNLNIFVSENFMLKKL